MSSSPTRRETLSFAGAAGLSALTGCGDDGNVDGTGGRLGTSGGVSGGGSGQAGNSSAGSSVSKGGSGAAGPAGGAGNAEGGRSTGEGGRSTGEGGAGGEPGDCQAKQETTVGPYPNANPLERTDVRGNTAGTTTPKEGAELELRVRVYDLGAFCAPISGAVVDIWQCDAAGVYAGYSAFGTVGEDFCRGYQQTDARGVAKFLTIFPGSYAGRSIHIHFSIQGAPSNLAPNGRGENLTNVFVAQLYFTQAIAEEIFGAFPIYQTGAAITPNASDGIFGDGGSDLLVTMTKSGTGYVGEVDIGVSRSAIGR